MFELSKLDSNFQKFEFHGLKKLDSNLIKVDSNFKVRNLGAP